MTVPNKEVTANDVPAAAVKRLSLIHILLPRVCAFWAAAAALRLPTLRPWVRHWMPCRKDVYKRQPIVRNGRKATVGYQPDVWKTWE